MMRCFFRNKKEKDLVLSGCRPEEAPVEPGLKELGSLLCAVQCVPAFP